ncbi:MAG: hypothetical protein L6243_03680 [Candidatus Altiarchaeales archaeon]|nr:hypothetical protein [Candidatus Altiarchaeota archaeon]MCG2782670.1 hypothetical protein [Candidatus Altiarchaeales archaeon]MBU4266219.1 hypothetical protein [Candidatus Altiarchaeota archaeon]MBU4342066.1 hypothetical protein [Candidatus Altiarchaeota archaeon]MBU4406054.1 hypothetical protein [Candidatus Altiarchaeota archaeon]
MEYTQISLKLPKKVLKRYDQEARFRYKKRSELMREALVSYIEPEIHKGSKAQKQDYLLEILENPSTKGPSTDSVKELDEVVWG